MKVVTDTYIPFLADYLAKIATPSPLQIVSLPPEQITASVVQDADALFVRTRTQVNQTLLDKSIVRFVATATIGTDHLDTKYLDQQGISWVSAPGCNAQAVCDYIEAALDEVITPYIAAQHHSPSLPLTIGIVGCGHVGGKVLQMATQKGLKVLVNDPLKGFDTTPTCRHWCTTQTTLISRKWDICSAPCGLNTARLTRNTAATS